MPIQSTRKRRAQSDIRGPDAASPQVRRRTGTLGESSRHSKQGRPTNRRTQAAPESEEEEEAEEEEEDRDVEMGGTSDEGEGRHSDKKARMIKSLVRYALACEHNRIPIRRTDISAKVLEKSGRSFKDVFDGAQTELRNVFGMEMVELPTREKTKLSARRAAQTSDKNAAGSKSYMLVSVLPEKYRDPEVVSIPAERDAQYMGLVSFVTAVVYLNNRQLPEKMLLRYLRRFNADVYTPVEKTDRLLAMMIKHGYIVRVKDNHGDETTYDFHLGPRAKVEIGEEGVLALVNSVWGDEDKPDNLAEMVKNNIGVEIKQTFAADDAGENAGGRIKKKELAKKKKARGRRRDEDDEDDEEEEVEDMDVDDDE